jgi:predicted ATPase
MTAQSLRQQFTPFIGRQDELIEIANLLADPTCRLLTLMGPGGIGKTRLAAEVVHQLRDKFADGVYFVPLAPLKSSENMASAIIQSLSLSFIEGQSPENQLLNYLYEKQLLLALDNFEHLLDGVDLVADMLEKSSGVKILATSREPLNLRAEWIRQLDGLRFPQSDSVQNVYAYSALELFAERAQQVSGDFSLEDEMGAVIDICRLVDGMPLAFELEAAWRRALPCTAKRHEIQHGQGILASNVRDVPERHRSM